MEFYWLAERIKRQFSFLYKIIYKRFGKKSVIIKPIVISGKKRIEIGDGVTIAHGARIECLKNPEGGDSNIKIGNHCNFAQGAHITSAGKMIIGNHCNFAPRVLITNIDHDYSEPKSDGSKLIVSDVVIGDYCSIGMDAKIFPGVTLGENVIVGASAIVTHDVPNYCIVVGAPAHIIKKYDFELKRWVKV